MENRKIILLATAVFALACLPFLILYASGQANAGLGTGFQSLLHPNLTLILIFGIGAWSPWVGRDAPVIVPLTFLLIFAIASLIWLNVTSYPFSPWFVLGAMLIYTVALFLVDTRRYVVAITISSSVAFQLGRRTGMQIVEMQDSLFFLLGQFLALTLIMATAVCFSMAVGEYLWSQGRRLLAPEGGWLTSLRSWFV